MDKPIKIVKPFFKVNFEDLQFAKDFFENEKHYIEWLFCISEYYQDNIIVPKTKIVAKYFNNYKKTMDFIIDSKAKGKEGAMIKAEKQQVNNDTLEGVLEGGFKEPLQLIIKNKVLSNKHKELTNAIALDFDLFWNIYNKKIDKEKCLKVWRKIRIEEIPFILEKAKLYVKSNTDIQYRKNPLTWLNGKCWNDEISAPEEKIIYAFHNRIID
jgi:hypothetical protein